MRTYSIIWSFVAGLLFLGGCGTLNNPDMCRYITGPASVTVQGAMTGGTIMAQVRENGTYISAPRDPVHGCPALPTLTPKSPEPPPAPTRSGAPTRL